VIVFENQFAEFIQAFSSLFQSAAWYGAEYKCMKEIHAEAVRTYMNGRKVMENYGIPD
jgi:hypothetical protein